MRDGWVEQTLDEVVTIINGGTPSTKRENYWGGEIVWITTTELTAFDGKRVNSSKRTITQDGLNSGPARMVRAGTTLVGTTATIGTCAMAACDLTFNQQISGLIPKINKLDDGFLFYWIQFAKPIFEGLAAGTSFKRISTSVLKTVEIKFPPLPEQKRIVDLISSVDSYIESLQQQLDNARKSRNAVLHELLTAGGDDWLKTCLGDVADVIDPHPSHRAPAVDDDGIPFIGIGDLRNSGDIDFAKARRVSKNILEEHKARYDRSDFLIGLGRVASIGMVVRLPDERTDYVVSPTLAVIKAKDMLGQFLFYLLEGPHSQEQFQRFKKGSTRESVGMQILRKIEVHIPSLPEQKRIVEIISSIDKAVDKTQLTITEAKNLRSGLLSDLLSGNHQIPASYDKVIGAA
jgi:type I restriction enzyme, S subunit